MVTFETGQRAQPNRDDSAEGTAGGLPLEQGEHTREHHEQGLSSIHPSIVHPSRSRCLAIVPLSLFLPTSRHIRPRPASPLHPRANGQTGQAARPRWGARPRAATSRAIGPADAEPRWRLIGRARTGGGIWRGAAGGALPLSFLLSFVQSLSPPFRWFGWQSWAWDEGLGYVGTYSYIESNGM